jgi:hypothetical protein
MNLKIFNCFIFCILCSAKLWAQLPKTEFKGFGHIEYSLDFVNPNKPDSYFILGEHDLFVQSKITKRFSYLGEFVIRYNGASATKFLPSIERTLVKYAYLNNHSVIFGKIHTPINYWNDSYHHGRVFYPVISRPIAFSHFVPLHTIGMQAQGQNIGKWNFGYDVVVGNGIASTDIFDSNSSPGFAAAIHIKPIDGMRIGVSHYFNRMDENGYGSHSGHVMPTGTAYRGPLDFYLNSLSIAYFGKNFEILSESSRNLTRTDSLGFANNFSTFLYLGYVIKEKHVPMIMVDYINISNNDLHSSPMELLKLGLGYRYEFSHLLNVKGMLEYYFEHSHSHHGPGPQKNYFAIEMQLAYGF